MLPIYGDCCQYKLKELKTLQNRCIKALFRLPRLTPTTYLYSTSILSLHELAKVEQLTYMYKMVACKVKHNLKITRSYPLTLFNKSSNDSSNAALMTMIDEYNDLDYDTRQIRSVKTLKLNVMSLRLECGSISPYFYLN